METKINRGIVLRLAKYLRVLHKLKGMGFVKVFSNNLGDAIGVTPAVVRKDFSIIGIPGNKRGGYNIDVIIEEIERMLGKEDRQPIVVLGCGKIGNALIHYTEFERDGIEVVAGFEIDPALINPNAHIPIYPIAKLPEVAARESVKVAVIAVPDVAATEVFELVTASGIPGVLNFTSVDLKCGRCDFDECAIRCIVQNVNIGLEIENLFYLVRMKEADILDQTRSRTETLTAQTG
ncbi:redox-sensing transcriptional repressor Rex [Alkalispirochaeta sphaeroplastigenens]|uniref:redox-sensing transcriptional repressor Rex n=1 Tax=Alkalispirochaeta sphaeroplastigenens TaxID=1187066 RepID=UPI0015E15C8F|nr:redox-sensing transcriptional repressor Rex [Alkalispirochaeta sphaeroplastigenens]